MQDVPDQDSFRERYIKPVEKKQPLVVLRYPNAV